jgi:hypothetical protein
VTRFTLKSNLFRGEVHPRPCPLSTHSSPLQNTRRGEVHPRPCPLSTHSSSFQINTEHFTRLSHQIIEHTATSSIPKTLWSNLLSFPLKLTSDIKPFNFQNSMEQFTLLSPQIAEQSVSSSTPITLWSNVLAFLLKLPSVLPWQLTLYQSLTLLYTRCYAANTLTTLSRGWITHKWALSKPT